MYIDFLHGGLQSIWKQVDEEEHEEEHSAEDEEENKASEEEEIDDTPTSTSTAHRPFIPQKEEDIVQWMSKNLALYNSAILNWKSRNTRQEIIQMKAKDMGIQFGVLNQRIITQRNYYTKVIREKSGQAGKFLTEKPQWILDHFSFMRSFMLGPHQVGAQMMRVTSLTKAIWTLANS